MEIFSTSSRATEVESKRPNRIWLNKALEWESRNPCVVTDLSLTSCVTLSKLVPASGTESSHIEMKV